jgi:hypothetical protein
MRATKEVSMRCILYEAFDVGIEHLGDDGMELKTFRVRQAGVFSAPTRTACPVGTSVKASWFKAQFFQSPTNGNNDRWLIGLLPNCPIAEVLDEVQWIDVSYMPMPV